MVYVEEYTRSEPFGLGTRTIRFVLSDEGDDLFRTNAQMATNLGLSTAEFEAQHLTDVFVLGSSKESLKMEEGLFVAQELKFSVDQSAALTEPNNNALYFALEARTVNKNRFVAVFILDSGESPSVTNMDFLGKINHTVSGTDLLWITSDWGVQIDAKRDYQFSALSFDASVMKKITLEGTVELDDGTSVDAIYPRISDGEVAAVFDRRLTYKSYHQKRGDYDTPTGETTHYTVKTATIYDALRILLNHAEDILDELLNTTGSTITLESCDTGISVLPTYPLFVDTNWSNIDAIMQPNDVDRLIGLRINSTDYDIANKWSNPYIHVRMFDHERYSHDVAEPDWDDSIYKRLGFRNMESIVHVLAEVAKSFDMFVFIKFTGVKAISVYFKSYSEVVSSTQTYLIGAESGSLEVSPVVSSGETQGRVHGFGTINVSDGADYAIINHALEAGTTFIEHSEKFEKEKELREQAETYEGIKSNPALLTTSWTLRSLARADDKKLFSDWHYWNWQPLCNYEKLEWVEGVALGLEPVYTGIMIATRAFMNTALTHNQVDRCGTTDLWRMAGSVFINKDGANVRYDTLKDYINDSRANKSLYYENTYKIDTPCWSGFSADSGGASPSWKEVELGSVVVLKETIRRRNPSTGVWEDYLDTDGTEFVVDEIERFYNEPKTSLVLANRANYPFASYDDSEAFPSVEEELNSSPTKKSSLKQAGKVENWLCGETIYQHSVVRKEPSNGKCYMLSPEAQYHDAEIAIATMSGSADDYITVQKTGEYYSKYFNFTDYLGKLLYCRNSIGVVMENTNLSLAKLKGIEGVESLYVNVAKIIDVKTIRLNLHKYIIEDFYGDI